MLPKTRYIRTPCKVTHFGIRFARRYSFDSSPSVVCYGTSERPFARRHSHGARSVRLSRPLALALEPREIRLVVDRGRGGQGLELFE